ncbi:LOB domain-containing protein 7 [Ziziphus jujuba]|uniref:LOB domain-containing protein 7 n=1 Tax=Ziziphus jujuba TaxID=326968 RepID=A0A6P3ZWV8_ZIZJJ|nr:LOB domain-containing protein 7 [Ziziphus jujuba]
MRNTANSKNRKLETVCAACRYQRKRCPPDCPLAPYFPSNRENDFHNARKLFGINNMLKLIKNLDPPNKHIAMKSIIFQANKRALDPVGGCHRIILDLELLIQAYTSELQHVLHKLDLCRKKALSGPFPMPPSCGYPLQPPVGTHHQALPYNNNNLQQQHTDTCLPFGFLQPVEEEHGLQENYYFGVDVVLNDGEAVSVVDWKVKEEKQTDFNLDPVGENNQTHRLHSTGTIQSSDKAVSEEDVNATLQKP